MNKLSEAEKRIGYEFRDKSLLEQALTHSSYANEHKSKQDYERLEFLGDAVLNYVTGLILFELFPTMKEEHLTKFRAGLVQEKTLAEITDKLGLMDFVNFSSGKQQTHPVFSSDAVKCDVFEAVLGAILIDSGKNLTLIRKIAEENLSPYFTMDFTDYKSLLLEKCAKKGISVQFECEETTLNKQQVYTVSLYINHEKIETLSGDSKKKTEKTLAKNYFKKNIL